MATTITAGNATNGAAISSDNTGILELKSGTGSGTTAVTVSTGQNVTFAQTANLPNTFGFKNRIINGAMVIDQRNAGAAINPATNNAYCVDRWLTNTNVASKYSVQQNAGSVTPPTGFTYYLGATSLSAYSVGSSDSFALVQKIEGYNFADLDFGKATAKTVTISFWVRSSLTGTFGGSLTNGAIDRSYPFTYTVSSANTWEQKSVTIAGDTSGTWLTTNGIGAWLWFGLGMGSTLSGTAGAWAGAEYRSATGATSVVGTNGATFYITGVQLEKGSTATSFDYRPYTTELQLCQRYYQRLYANNTQKFALSRNGNTTEAYGVIPFYVPMRVAPSALEQSGTAANYAITHGVTTTTCSAVPAINSATLNNIEVFFTVASGLTAGQASVLRSLATDQFLGWSAEL
jgi:hypothetical protein